MKTAPEVGNLSKTRVGRGIVPLLVLIVLSLPNVSLADGCFVQRKFVWDKQRDINEPTQKAILVHDGNRQDMLLQVKYAGPIEDFGWIVPVPSLPAVEKGSMECFYELSKITQRSFPDRVNFTRASLNSDGDKDAEPPVKVIEIKTVGDYDITILSANESAALESWLRKHEFALPPGASSVIDHYVQRRWHFVAARINIKSHAKTQTAFKLANGELHPLLISFQTDRCIFPLKISSLNNTPSEVHLYVLSSQPLIEHVKFGEELAAQTRWRSNSLAKRSEWHLEMKRMRAHRDLETMSSGYLEETTELSDRSMIDETALTHYLQPARAEIPACSRLIPLLKTPRNRWLTKVTWNFKPDEMRDLEFVPAVPLFSEALEHSGGALAAANLVRLGSEGMAALLASLQHTNDAVRAHAASVAGEMRAPTPHKATLKNGSEYPMRAPLHPKLLPLLPILMKDRNPEVRLHAVYAAVEADERFFTEAAERLRDEEPEVSRAAITWFSAHARKLSDHVPTFRRMLSDTNEYVQIAGMRALTDLGVELSREELLALFKYPRMELAGAAFGRLKPTGVSCEEARPLLQNSLGIARVMGMSALAINANRQSVEFALPMLKDTEPAVRRRAHNLLSDLTGQEFPADQVQQWEQWWAENKATFMVTVSHDQLREKQLQRARKRSSSESSPK